MPRATKWWRQCDSGIGVKCCYEAFASKPRAGTATHEESTRIESSPVVVARGACPLHCFHCVPTVDDGRGKVRVGHARLDMGGSPLGEDCHRTMGSGARCDTGYCLDRHWCRVLCHTEMEGEPIGASLRRATPSTLAQDHWHLCQRKPRPRSLKRHPQPTSDSASQYVSARHEEPDYRSCPVHNGSSGSWGPACESPR